jgi:hypothetical protein
MDSDIEFLEYIFDQMKEAGLMETKAEFSQLLLGKGPSYLTSMSARDRIVPMEVLDQMSLRLLDRAERAKAAIAAMEVELCAAVASAHRGSEIRNEFEDHRRRRLAAELSDVDDTKNDHSHAPTTSRFVQMMLRTAGLVKGPKSPSVASIIGRTLH